MTPVGIKILLYFMVVIMNAPLPTPRKTTANGKTQQREATNAEARLTVPDFKLDIHILIILQNRYSLLKYHVLRLEPFPDKPQNKMKKSFVITVIKRLKCRHVPFLDAQHQFLIGLPSIFSHALHFLSN